MEGGEQAVSGLRTRESKAGLVGVCVCGGGVWASRGRVPPWETDQDTECPPREFPTPLQSP